eukprot:scaffold24251_cov40-Attheya_sp.AAC.3
MSGLGKGGKSGAGLSKKRKLEEATEEDSQSVNHAILNVLKTQNKLLNSIDARLGRIERQDQGGIKMQGQRRRESPHVAPVSGTWKFAESDQAKREREQRTSKHAQRLRWDQYQCQLVGKVGSDASLLIADRNRRNQDHNISALCPSHKFCYNKAPIWCHTGSMRHYLPEVVFNDQPELKQKSGIYHLAFKYNNKDHDKAGDFQKAAIIVGEVLFSDDGFVNAEGADWDRLLGGQKQTQLPYAHGARGIPSWLHRKISEPWVDGDELKFRIDTNENTIVFQRSNYPEKVFWNILAFTNNRNFPDYVRVYAYAVYAASGAVADPPPSTSQATLTLIQSDKH